MLLQIRHETLYRYTDTVRYAIQALHLTPRREARQQVVSWAIHTPGRCVEQVDAHGNVMHYLTMETPHRELRVLVDGVVDTDEIEGQPNSLLMQLSPLAYRSPTPLTTADARMAQFAREGFTGGTEVARLLAGAGAVVRAVAYRPGATQVSDTALSAFERGEGVCQDQAHVFAACCRALGMAARYVSGYLLSDGDQVASHAWVEVWQEQGGYWYGIDVTHCMPAGARHCRLAVGRDYLDAAPVRGMRRGGGEERMQVAVLVTGASQQ